MGSGVGIKVVKLGSESSAFVKRRRDCGALGSLRSLGMTVGDFQRS